MKKQEWLTITEAAKLLGISRQAVFKKIKKGQLMSEKIGHLHVIDADDIKELVGEQLTVDQKRIIDEGVKRTFKEYKEVLKLLGKE